MKNKICKFFSLCLLACVCLFSFTACVDKQQTANQIKFNTLTVTDLNVYGKVSNDTETFSFLNEITVEGSVSFIVDDEIGCQTPILSKTVQLEVGDNVFYVLEMVGNKESKLYTVTIRRKPMYVVAFNSNGGSSIDQQIVEEDAMAQMPSNPTKQGYDFNGWDFDINNSKITQSITINASWVARNDTPYKVEHYVENVDDNNYTLAETENLTGTTDFIAFTMVKNFDHFSYSHDDGVQYINADGSTVSRIYYQRERFAIVFNGNGGTLSSGVESQNVKYQGSAISPSYSRDGYTFNGFDKCFDNVSEQATITAQWIANENTIYLNGNGSTSGQMQSIKAKTDEVITLPASTLVRKDYFFTGWATETEGKVKYSDEDAYVVGTASTQTLYACWRQLTDDGFVWMIQKGLITITDYVGDKEEVEIPYSIDGIMVGKIGKYAFADNKTIKKVCFANDSASETNNYFIEISDYAFSGCVNLKEIDMQNRVDKIGYYAFDGCSSIKNFVIPDSVKEVDVYFANNQIEEITIGKSVQKITTAPSVKRVNYNGTVDQWAKIFFEDTFGDNWSFYINDQLVENVVGIGHVSDYAFRGCQSLKSIETNGNIGEYAFWGCKALQNVYISNSAGIVKDSAFTGCESLQYNEKDGLKYLGGSGVNGYHADKYLYLAGTTKYSFADQTIVVDNDCKFIAKDAFKGCNIYKIILPNRDIVISDDAIANCSIEVCVEKDGLLYLGNADNDYYYLFGVKDKEIYSAEIDEKCRIIGDYAFDGCEKLNSVKIPKNVISIGKYAFRDCAKLHQINIPQNVNIIGYGAFEDSFLGYITIENGVQIIDDYAFYGCPLVSLDIPNSIVSIGDHAFEQSEICSIFIGEGVKRIGDYAFSDCANLSHIRLGKGLEEIGYNSFMGCKVLSKLEYTGDVDDWVQITFNDNPIRYAKNLILYRWEGVNMSETVYNPVVKYAPYISAYAFAYSNISSITIEYVSGYIGQEMFYIEYRAFEGCENLEEVSINKWVDRIRFDAFSGCTAIKKVSYIDATHWAQIEFENEYANPMYYCSSGEFYCDSEKTVVIDTEIVQDYVYYNNFFIENVIIKDGVTIIGERAFAGCINLKSIVIPDSVKIIGERAFSGCVRLEGVVIPNGVENIGNYAFNSCDSLTSVTIGNGVTSIGNYAFYGCSKLTSIEIPDSVTSIDSYAFYRCDSLTSVTIGNGVTSIGSSAFEDCRSLTSITIGNGLTSIGSSAFYRCESLESIVVASGNTKYHSKDNCLIETATNTLVLGCKNSVIPNYITSIGSSAFERCSSLRSIEIPDSVTSIGDYAFWGCSSLETIYCEAESKPSGWSSGWNDSCPAQVIWGYKGN